MNKQHSFTMVVQALDNNIKKNTGKRAKHLPSLAQRRGASLAQLRLVAETQKKPSQHAVASFLALQSRELNSRILAAVSQRAAADPFVKVRKMIEDMINKLMDEAEEAEHKGFCDEELSTNQA